MLLLFESFKNIESICKEYKIKKYTINPDGSIDVNGDVNLSNKGLTKLPLKFGKVTGYFDCAYNKLTTLDGCPIYVGGNFSCNYNKLITTEGCPIYVGGDFSCRHNQLISLEGCPKEIGGGFDCNENELISLEGCPIEVVDDFTCFDNPIEDIYELFPNHKSFMDSLDYNYLRGRNIVKYRFQDALDEIGKKVPKSIDGYRYIDI
jgi:hypothetical protein